MLLSVLACLVLMMIASVWRVACKTLDMNMFSCVKVLSDASVIMHIHIATSSWHTVCCRTQGALPPQSVAQLSLRHLAQKSTQNNTKRKKQHTTHNTRHKKHVGSVEEGTDLLQGEVLELQ